MNFQFLSKFKEMKFRDIIYLSSTLVLFIIFLIIFISVIKFLLATSIKVFDIQNIEEKTAKFDTEKMDKVMERFK